ncbi:MAG: glycosyltransferase family 4 protein [Acidimicrobiia bacterium]
MREFLDSYASTVAALLAGTPPPDPGPLLDRLDGIPTDLPAVPAQAARPGCLNVALVCREYPPDTAFGGMATFTVHLAHGLADAGHRVAVITAGEPGVGRDHDGRVDVVRIAPRAAGASDSFEALNRRGWLDYSPLVFFHSLGALRAIRELESRHGPFDVLDLADHCGEGIAPALFWPGPTTVRLYSPWALLAGMRDGQVSPGDAAGIPVLESALLRRATVLTSPSVDLSARVRTFFDLDAPIAIVPNPMDTEWFSPAPDERAGPDVTCCFVGRLEERKGIHDLLECIPMVIEHAPQTRFEIIGSDPDGVASTLRVPDPSRVRFRSPVPLTEVRAIYRSADVAVVPSRYDNSPFTSVEAMACGTPVVGTSAGGTAEYVVDGETGVIVPPRDPEALAQAIVRLVNDAPVRSRMGRAARSRVVETYDYRVISRRMEAEYRAAIENGERGPAAVEPVRSDLNRLNPQRNQVEAIVLAGLEDGDLVVRTVERAQDCGARVTVVWDGPVPPSFPGARTTGTSRHAGLDAARLLPALISPCFVVLRAGDVVAPGILERARRTLVETGASAVTVDGVRVALSAAARGLRLADAATWADVLDRVAARRPAT